MLADRGLVLDSANPDLKLIRAIAGVSDHIPELRIVIDHLPTARVPTVKRPPATSIGRCCGNWQKTGTYSSSFLKSSPRASRRQGEVQRFAQTRLDALWNVFGEDHVLYASDWPNSDHHATYAETISIVRDYVEPKGRKASEKFFWKNSVAAYRWERRQPDQPVLGEKV